MFQRWKLILSNWINCYYNKSSDGEQNLKLESLVTIISHLRENLNLDESKSSILEAHSVEEFLCEKYPEFKFENGTVEASNDRELCLSASLLLFFVCVNSKNFDIKNAMCSKLGAEDQETILKFSKCLLKCPMITVGEVQAAITEACGQDIAAMEFPQQTLVAETPPALRSLHSNVRRLQAALDAERFDRTYLQEELARTNNRLERLLKDKEQHKLEILNLKAKISLCCGDETVAKNSEAAADVSDKLTKQLQHLELRLEETQMQLDDVAYERDLCKAKIDELKNDRDKWLTLSQQENARVTKLTEELETERRHNQSLKELLTELRQHNRLNGMDCSVECDDPDTSIHSLQHDSSICSEVCANVVEVQLGEERVKVASLQQQIQTLQVQISELNQIREADKSTLKSIIGQRENDICNLKHRINEEIEKKNNLKVHFDNEKAKLNNENNELEQKLKENREYSNAVIEKNMEEIQTLQEEKLSLLHSLSNETNKLDNMIKDLHAELDSEKQSRSRMSNGYENHIMKLNEKVLNRNNELVELQNSVFGKGEQIENLQIELRNEKEAYSKLITQYQGLNEHTSIIQSEFKKVRESFKELMSEHQVLKEEKNTLQIEVEKGKKTIEQIVTKYQKNCEERDTIEKELVKEQEALKDLTNKHHDLNEQNNTLQNDLKKIKEAGKKLQNKYHTSHEHNKELKVELLKEKELYNELNDKYKRLNEQYKTMQQELVRNKEAFDEMNQKYKDVIEQKKIIQYELENANKMANEYGNKCLHLEEENNAIQLDLQKVSATFEQLTNEYREIVERNNTIQTQIKKDSDDTKELLGKYQKLEQENNIIFDKYQKLEQENNVIQKEFQKEKEAIEELSNKYQESVKQNNTMATELKKQKGTFEELLHEYRNLDEHRNKIANDLQLKCDEEQNLKLDLENKVHSLKEKLTDSENLTDKLKTSYESQIENLNVMVTKLTNYLKDKNIELEALRREKDMLQQTVGDSCKVVNSLEEVLKTERQNIEKLASDFESERQVLMNMVTVTESVMEDTRLRLCNEVSELLKAKDTLEVEKKELQALVNEFDMKYRDAENANVSLLSLLKIEQRGKENVEKESELVRDYLDQVIRFLKDDRIANTNVIQTLESQNRTLSERNEKFKNDYKELVVAMNALENELKSRAKKFEILYEEKSQLEKTLKETTLKLAVFQLEVNELKAEIVDITDENNKLKLKECESLAKIEELKVSISTLETEFQNQGDKLNIVLEGKTLTESELQSALGSLKVAMKEKSQSENNLRNEIQRLNVAQLEIKDLKSKIILLTDENTNLKLKENESVAKIKELEDNMSTLANELENKLKIISQEKCQLYNELQKLKDQLKTTSEKKTQLEATLLKETRKFTAFQLENKELESKITALFDENNNLKQENNKSATKLEEWKMKEIEFEKMIKNLEDNMKAEKQSIDKLTSDFQSEREILKDMVSATESIMEDTKISLGNEITQHLIANDCLEVEKKGFQSVLKDLEMKCQALEIANTTLLSLLKLERKVKQDVEKESELVRDYLDEVIGNLSKERNSNISVISALEFQEKVMAGDYEKIKNDLEVMQTTNRELKVAMKVLDNESKSREDKLQKVLDENLQMEKELKLHADQLTKVLESKSQIEKVLNEKMQNLVVVQLEIKELKSKMADLFNENNHLELAKKESCAKIKEFKALIDSSELKEKEELSKLKAENQQLLVTIEENRTVITNLEQLIKHELEENYKLRDENEQEKLVMANRVSQLQDDQAKAEKVMEERQKEIVALRNQVQTLHSKVDLSEQDSKAKDGLISKMSKEKDSVISTISKELVEEKALREKLEKELQTQKSIVSELRNNMEISALKKENEQLIRAIGQQETFTALCQEKVTEKYACHQELRDSRQVDSSSSDHMHSSVESLKTITDLEKIIHDKNRTITTLQTDITYLKSLMAESETKLLDVTKELEISKENSHQLSSQLKKIVQLKNEEIADLKKQVTKMSATENRATQIIKVSAKYQAMIVKRVAEIKSNTVLKELTNFGNSDNDVRRSLAGSITMEDLENFLETTDRHLKRCSEKQIALQKDRDRLSEVNRIHESELINMKKFLTELSVSFQTFSSMKDLYGHKLSRVISAQRTVRREILSLDGRITDASMCKLERGYGAAMQDLSECTMNLERWVERCISRTVSAEKIKQAFTSDTERLSLASPSFQNTGLEIQLEELEKTFQKLLEEIAWAVKNEGAAETQAATVMEVRAEYEDKLNRMKAKMKELFNEQMAILKNKQREEIELLERELQKTRTRMEDSKREYERHIKDLTKELWTVGEKYLVKNDEAEWLRRKQRSGSLMSLQHVHSSGLVPPPEVSSRPSDAHSLRSLRVSSSDHQAKNKRDGRGLHMSDEEGEVFDNRCLKELAMTPRHGPPGERLSELKWRNSLCPPHLKSSYPAETQFAPTLDEDDLKAGASAAVAASARGPRKEVGITAYKKPGPPTPSKQAGRLSATDSELRESLRVENDPHHTERKTSTPARFRAFLRLNKHDSNEGTPRARRLSNIFRRKQ